MPAAITVDARLVGRPRPLFDDWRIELPPEVGRSGRLTLSQLIEHIVRDEVRAFEERREQRRLPRVLSPAEIEQGLLRGKVDPGGREPEPDVDSETAIATALQSFQDGLYYVFVDGQQKEDLREAVELGDDSRVTFLRLVALAGG